MNKGILFFIGLLVGILCCVLIYRFDKKMFNRIPLIKEKEIVVTRVDTVYVEMPPKQRKREVEIPLSKLDETENFESEDTLQQISIFDSEFSFEGREVEEVFSDQLLETRTVKVTLLFPEKHEGKLPENFFQFFEIQQWSTLAKNKKTYYRNQNLVKIKGMKIDSIHVVFWEDSYFLEIGNQYYIIPETKNYEKMNLVIITQ
jgi:hypothetical protein